ncbi:MAG: hypothetical protein WD227_14460 [Vicinamibacterales bacterium]
MGQKETALIVVRTYPVPAKKGVEVSCTAAITQDGRWLRLFPVPYRRLSPEQKFHKYDWIEVEVERAADPRPESHRILAPSIRILNRIGTEHEWQLRKDVIFPLKSTSLCAIQQKRNEVLSPTLGIFRPKITRLLIEPSDSPSWTEAERQILSQGDLFQDESVEALEKIPFDFRYEFTCETDGCRGHSLKCTDWEMGESWRRWQPVYGEQGWEAAFRQKYEHEMMNRFDTHFYVGTLHQFPNAWIIVGLFYPPKSTLSLFPD